MSSTTGSTHVSTSPTWGTWKDHKNASPIVFFEGNNKSHDAEGVIVTITVKNRNTLEIRSESGALLRSVGVAHKMWAAPAPAAATSSPVEEAPADGMHHVKLTRVKDSDGVKPGTVKCTRTFKDRNAAQAQAALLVKTGDWTAEIVPGRAPEGSQPGKRPGSVPAPAREREPKQESDRDKPARASSAAKLHPCRCGCGSQVKNLFAQGHDARFVSKLAGDYRATVQGNSTEHEVKVTRAAVLAEVQFSEPLTRKLSRSIELIDEKAANAAEGKAA